MMNDPVQADAAVQPEHQPLQADAEVREADTDPFDILITDD